MNHRKQEKYAALLKRAWINFWDVELRRIVAELNRISSGTLVLYAGRRGGKSQVLSGIATSRRYVHHHRQH